MVHIERVCRQNEPGDLAAATATMEELGRIIDPLTFPLNVAAGVEARGFDPGVPKSVVSTESRARYERIVAELAALFDRRGLARAAR
jgi:4-hydroxy-tetrahydrodipicolinate synthase